MLRFALVLLLAQCALGAQVLKVSTVRWSPTAVVQSGLITSSAVQNAFGIVDSGDTNVYVLIGREATSDLAAKTDPLSQIVATALTMSILGETSTVLPGDACIHAQLIRASTGSGDTKAAVNLYSQIIKSWVDNIVSVANGKPSVWTSVPNSAVCSVADRWYDVDTVWSNIITGYPLDASLFNELYCTARRLSAAWNVRSNNVGGAITAAVTPAGIELWTEISEPASVFIYDLSTDNLARLSWSAQNLKAALDKAVA